MSLFHEAPFSNKHSFAFVLIQLLQLRQIKVTSRLCFTGEAESKGPVAGTSLHRPIPCQLWRRQTDRWVCIKGAVSWLIIENRLSHFLWWAAKGYQITEESTEWNRTRILGKIIWMEMIAFHWIRFCDFMELKFPFCELILVFLCSYLYIRSFAHILIWTQNILIKKEVSSQSFSNFFPPFSWHYFCFHFTFGTGFFQLQTNKAVYSKFPVLHALPNRRYISGTYVL